MTTTLLRSVDDVASAARLRSALVTDHRVLPEIAKAVARSVVAAPDRFTMFAMLCGFVSPWAAVRLLRECGLLGDVRR